MAVIPYVIEQSPRGERVFDIYSRLLRDRVIFLGTEVDDNVGRIVAALKEARQSYQEAAG